jgi:hypothetical protein
MEVFMNLQQVLGSALNEDTIRQMSQNLGTDPQTTGNAVQAALPMLLGAMAHGSSTEEGASSLLGALDRDHDGSILNDLAGFLGGGDTSSGQGILSHVLGGNTDTVATGVSQASGLSVGNSGRLLAMLAPILMGALGSVHRTQGGLDQGSLPGLLGNASQEVGGSSGIVGMMGRLLDQNQDGSAVDDLMRMAGGFLSRGN